jgi:CheY-like chemotaxis protein
MTEPARRILLVDDDVDLRQSLAEALESAGYLVVQAANGAEAIESLRSSERPAVILLDLLMPVMNGWQFCELKQRDPDTAHIPVLAMSAAVSKDPTSPYYINVDDFIAKPVELDALLSKVGQLAAREGPG